MTRKINAVAIDGPAGSGKSTVSRLAAEKLGYVYVDTGAMYRALTLKAMRKNISMDDEESITEASIDMDLKLLPSDDVSNTVCVLLDGEDISADIRLMEVTGNVKYVARIPAVRENLVKLQRQMVAGLDGSVMEGRDIGTVVLPDAEYKFFLDASFEERIERRFAELRAKGHPVPRDEVEDDLKQRDHTDRTRKAGPLKMADDAVLLDTTSMSIDEVVAKIVNHVRG